MKKIFTITTILSLFGCGQKDSKQADNSSAKTEQYVSMSCQTGDITLTLNPDNTFDLTILFWDNNTKSHKGSESIKGTWTKNQKDLVLKTSDNKNINYALTTTNMKIGDMEINSLTYGFKSADINFFGSDIDLLEREQTDNFLRGATKQK